MAAMPASAAMPSSSAAMPSSSAATSSSSADVPSSSVAMDSVNSTSTPGWCAVPQTAAMAAQMEAEAAQLEAQAAQLESRAAELRKQLDPRNKASILNPERVVLPAPPVSIHDSLEEAEAAVHAFAREHGYGIMRQGPGQDKKGNMKCMRIRCDQGGISGRSKKPKEGIRNSTTRRKGCPFRLVIRKVRNAETTDISWKVDTTEPAHNHGASSNPSSHPSHRAKSRSPEVMQCIRDGMMLGNSPQEILKAVQTRFPKAVITIQDIYNARKSILKKFKEQVSQTSDPMLEAFIAKNEPKRKAKRATTDGQS